MVLQGLEDEEGTFVSNSLVATPLSMHMPDLLQSKKEDDWNVTSQISRTRI